uniref:PIPK domain-containing protein n=1 Tax=Alexandrium monilatum TaxID=311494 RepID=A0A7S4SQ80_9DINO
MPTSGFSRGPTLMLLAPVPAPAAAAVSAAAAAMSAVKATERRRISAMANISALLSTSPNVQAPSLDTTAKALGFAEARSTKSSGRDLSGSSRGQGVSARRCSCRTRAPGAADLLLGLTGGLAAVACLVVLGIDVCGPSGGRSPAQAACLRWSNVCDLFYSLYYIFYVIGDLNQPFREPGGMKSCGWAWAGFFGQARCHGSRGAQPLCFLDCCVVAVPWLEFFGYGSLLWNIFWLCDLVRFTYNPLAPEKLWGMPLKRLYHCCAWPIALLIAFNPDLSRLDTECCRQASIVMMPCLLRHGNIKQDVPWIHIIGLGIACIAVLIVARRYAAISNTSPCSARQTLDGVRHYLKGQWRHTACLAACWIAILVDTSRKCKDDFSSYATAVFFAGLGFFLGFDRLLTACQARHRRRVAGALRTVYASAQLPEAQPPAQIPSWTVTDSGEVSRPEIEEYRDDYRLLDMETLIEHIMFFFRREEEKLKVMLSGECLQSKLDTLATFEDDQSPLGQDAFWAMSPTAFAYLRRLWKVSEERISDQLLQSQADLEGCIIRTASKSGSSILNAPDGRTFVIKTVSEEDCRNLQLMLPAYRHHFQQHPDSLLCKVYGCYSLRNSLGSRLYVVLMECLRASPTGLECSGTLQSQTFDMKSEFQDGGFISRFPKGLHFLEDSRLSDELLQADYMFLASVAVVDYSVLLTIWRPDQAAEHSGDCGFCGTASHPYHSVQYDDPGWSPRQDGCAVQTSASKLAVARLGIIDFFQTYNTRKLAESVLKRSLVHPRHPAERVTIVHPQLYAERQLEFVSRRVLGRMDAPIHREV